MLSSSMCGHFTRKHHYIIVRKLHGGVIMKCQWTLCQHKKFVHHDFLRSLLVAV